MFNFIKTGQFLYKSTLSSVNRVLGLKTQNCYSSNSRSDVIKLTIVGGAGKIGESLCLMLKQSPLIEELCIYDLKNTDGLSAELNLVDTNCKVVGLSGKQKIGQALQNAKLVVILASAPDNGNLDFNGQWTQNAQIVQDIVTEFSKHSPQAFLVVGTHPINSMIPMACETLKKTGVYNPKTIFGITTLDAVRANTFAARVLGVEPESVLVPVIGGHSEETTVPVLSNTKPNAVFSNEELEFITQNVKRAHNHMLKLQPAESAPLSKAFACARFIISLLKGMRGYKDIVECAYVPSQVHPDIKYLSTPLLLGPNGILENLGIPMLSNYESHMLKNSIKSLVEDINKGEKFVRFDESSACKPCDVQIPKCSEVDVTRRAPMKV